MGSPWGHDKKYFFTLSSDRKIVGKSEVITKVDSGSDHRRVRAKVEVNNKINEIKENPKTKATQIRP